MKSSPKYEKVGELMSEIKNYHVNSQDTTTIVSSYLGAPIKRLGGRPYWLCPFHPDKTASFSVNKKNGKCGCFACAMSFSNGIDFVQEYSNLTLQDAVLVAGDILGLDTGIDVSAAVTQKPRNIVKVEIPKMTEKKIIDHRKLNIAYSALLEACRMENGQYYLDNNHLQELTGKRQYTMSEITAIQFFSYPEKKYLTNVIKKIEGIIEKQGYNVNQILSYVPGFFYNRAIRHWQLMKLNGKGYGFPIHDENNNIVAIQIRLTSESMNTMKYTWLTSAFAMNTKESDKEYVLGNTPGAPLSVVYPKNKLSNRLLITEGFHKAYQVVNNFDFDSYTAITVQGVNNTEGIAQFSKNVCDITRAGFLDIAFDGDMAIKETVLKPALKLGLNLSGLPFSKDMIQDVLNILSQSNKDKETIASVYKKQANEISHFLHENEQEMWFAEISFLLWENEDEKGIDDLIFAGKQNCVKRISLADFWDLSYSYLSQVDNERLAKAQSENKEFRKTDIEMSRRTEIFRNVANKIKVA